MNNFASLLRQFELLRDKFIPQHDGALKTSEEKYRFQLLSGLIIAAVFLLSLFNTHYLLISGVKHWGNLIAILLTGLLGSFHLILLFNLKKQTSCAHFSNYFVSSIFITICIGIFFTGGSLNNATSYFLNVPILTAFLLLGKLSGFIYAILSLLFYLSIALLEHNGLVIPQTIPLRLYTTVEVLLWLFFFGTIVLFSSTYNHLTYKLMRQQEYEQEKQTYYATHDSLTLLPNRHKFDQRLFEALARSKRQNTQTGLYLIDLDGFKPINDQFGHDAGDALLRHVANNINMALRSDDMAARIGGDEFVIITQGSITSKSIEQLSKRLLEAIEQPLNYMNDQLQVSASIGISVSPDNGSTPDILMKCADTAMYNCKNSKHRWEISRQKPLTNT